MLYKRHVECKAAWCWGEFEKNWVRWKESKAVLVKAASMMTWSAYQQQRGKAGREDVAQQINFQFVRMHKSASEEKQNGAKTKEGMGKWKKEAESIVSKLWRYKDNSTKSTRLELQAQRLLLLVPQDYVTLP